jgi:two-component system, NarL family, invasion response regulator UvrY
MRILIVDDHALFREGVKQILEHQFSDAVFGEAASASEALALFWAQPWEVVLLDVSMHGRSGLDVLKEIRASPSKVPALVLSAYPEDQYARRALKTGAAGYLTKECLPQELCRAVRKVCNGGKYISSTLAEQLAAEVQTSDRPAHEALSNREYQVMLLLAAGKVPKEVGNELCLSVKTVGTYRARVLQKLKLKNNAEIMRYVMEQGLS